MADHYPYRIVTRREDLTLIWRPGEGDALDEFVVDGLGRLLAFHDLETLREYCDRNDRELIQEDEAALDLAAVRRWIERPDPGAVSAGLLLDAWNFFEDLSRSLQAAPSLPSQGPIHDSAYEKIFGGEALNRPLVREPGRARRPRPCANSCARGWFSGGRPCRVWHRPDRISGTFVRTQPDRRCGTGPEAVPAPVGNSSTTGRSSPWPASSKLPEGKE
ncbi:hypothetical protein ACR6C2_35530 [Streptomyces sp. INA 01156]